MALLDAASADAAGGHCALAAAHAETEVRCAPALVQKVARAQARAPPPGGGPEAGGGPAPPVEWADAPSPPGVHCVSPEMLLRSLAEAPFETVFAGDMRVDEHCHIRNLDTGEVRLLDPIMMTASFMDQEVDLNQLAEQVDRPWQSWWSEKRRKDERLFSASGASDLATLKEALAPPTDGGPPVDLDAKTQHGHGALHLAAASGRPEVVQMLLDANANVDIKTDTGLTPLHVASERGHLRLAQLLVNAGASVDAETEDRSLAIHLAAATGRLDVIALLLAHGGPQQLLVRNKQGQCPAEASLDSGTALYFEQYQRKLLESGHDLYAMRTSFCKGTVLLRNARADVVQRLLQQTQLLAGATGGTMACIPPFRPSAGSCPQFCVSSNAPGHGTPKVRGPFARVRSDGPELEKVGPNSFELVKLLGKGSFGEVFQVKHKRTEQVYAMKVLQKSRIMSSNLLRYALTERNILAYVHHPYIVSLHYAFQTQSHLVLVLQYCPRGNLQHLILREKRLREPIARLYTAEILLALIHLHERKTIFRDLKPDNVVLDEKSHAMLTDFGLSKEGVLGSRGTKSFCGSVAFLAPEILLRRGHGHTVDIYNLGVLLFNMLTGLPPFYHPDRETLFANIKHARLEVPEYVPKAARSLILSTMEREPSRRLGAAGTVDVQQHQFFSEIDFDALMQRKVPVPAFAFAQALRPWCGERPASPLHRAVPESPFGRVARAASWRASRGAEGNSAPVCGWTFAAIPSLPLAEGANEAPC